MRIVVLNHLPNIEPKLKLKVTFTFTYISAKKNTISFLFPPSNRKKINQSKINLKIQKPSRIGIRSVIDTNVPFDSLFFEVGTFWYFFFKLVPFGIFFIKGTDSIRLESKSIARKTDNRSLITLVNIFTNPTSFKACCV
jgi:hypothetical protein